MGKTNRLFLCFVLLHLAGVSDFTLIISLDHKVCEEKLFDPRSEQFKNLADEVYRHVCT